MTDLPKTIFGTVALLWLLFATFAPEHTGSSAHKWFNEIKSGWDQVQP